MAQFQQKLNSKLEQSASEEQIKQLFSKVGQIVHFRLVHDRDTGRPKGFGFCEFTEAGMADAAIRHFQGYELNGRALRVDSASASDRNVEETQQMQMAVQAAKEQITRVEESPYGKEPEKGKAPEQVTRTVSSMPPEQMFVLMKEMKHLATKNPSQLRQFLTENPQLAYALLQAQVVMRVVDPKVAYSMLHRETPATNQPFHQIPGVSNGGPPPYLGANPPQYRPPMPPAGYQGPPPPSASGGMFHPPRFSGPPPSLPPAPAPAPSAPAPANTDDEQNAAMLMRVMQLTDEQIQVLSPEYQNKVIALRSQLLRARKS